VRQCPKCGASYADPIAFCPNDGTPTVVPAAERGEDRDSLLGVVIDGRYRLEERIGEGGMGVVYRAAHVVLKKPFAIKIMRGEQAHDPEVVQRFVQEARAASGIGHPNIVNINDFGSTADGAVYLAMEFLAGQTLAEAMQSGPIAQDRALDIFVQIAGALEAAHERGIVHRDLKPENIFLKRELTHPDFVKVLDFGIAKVKNAAAKITRTGMVFGTPHYMSPEQAAGQPVDHRSDIYSLGVIMYQVLAGQLPFDAVSFMDLVTKHMYEPPLPLRQACPSDVSLPSALEAHVMRCLQKKPEDRPQTMRELQEALQQVQLRPTTDPAPAAPKSLRPVPEPSVPSVPPVRERSLAPVVGSSTLEEAARSDVVGYADDDEPIAVPKQRRRIWLWAAGAGVLGAIALLSTTGAPSHEVQPAETRAVDAGVAVPAPDPAAAQNLPAVLQPPAANDSSEGQKALTGTQTQAGSARSSAAAIARPVKSRPTAPAASAAPRAERSAAATARPETAPARPAPAPAQRKPTTSSNDEPLDPWR